MFMQEKGDRQVGRMGRRRGIIKGTESMLLSVSPAGSVGVNMKEEDDGGIRERRW